MKRKQNELEMVAGRAERLIGALTDTLVSTLGVAADRVEALARLAQLRCRMGAFWALLEGVAAQKEMLLSRLESARGPLRALLEGQIGALGRQEQMILRQAGVSAEPVPQALPNGNGEDNAAGAPPRRPIRRKTT
jgi:hypothetical protein